MIRFKCSNCSNELQTPPGSQGKRCQCPSCGNQMTVPEEQQPNAWETIQSGSNPIPLQSPVPGQPSSHGQPSSSGQPSSYGQTLSSGQPGRPTGTQPHRASTIQVLGVLGLFISLFGCACCGFVSPLGLGLTLPAIFMGKADMKAMDAGTMDAMGRSGTQIGIAMGVIGAVLSVFKIALMLLSLGINLGQFI